MFCQIEEGFMKWRSTRKNCAEVSISDAISMGLAPDGGLFVPVSFPEVDLSKFSAQMNISQIAFELMKPFFKGDVLENYLENICHNAFSFDVPLKKINDNTFLLELFHGPTAAFKDFGARFLSECFKVLYEKKKATKTILVATSGDTGGAVACAFHKNPGVNVAVLFPLGKVSQRQQAQLTCWGDNVLSFGVSGVFDDCQKIVKAAFQDQQFNESLQLTSANSINVGRLLPQVAYYVAASIWHFSQHQKKPSFVIPSGNVGNAVGAFWARTLGFPIDRIALATNANQVIPEYLNHGNWQPKSSIATLANAMDVGNPSNMERLFDLFENNVDQMRKGCGSLSVSDEIIQKVIVQKSQNKPDGWGEVICPHTATAAYYRDQLDQGHWIVVSTAHPAKFDLIVEPLLNKKIELPESLSQILNRPTHFETIDPHLNSFKLCIEKGFVNE